MISGARKWWQVNWNFIRRKHRPGKRGKLKKHSWRSLEPQIVHWNTVLYPRSLTWNLKINPWKRRFLLETIIFRFHVKLWGCICFFEIVPFSGNYFQSVSRRVNFKHPPFFSSLLSPVSPDIRDFHGSMSKGLVGPTPWKNHPTYVCQDATLNTIDCSNPSLRLFIGVLTPFITERCVIMLIHPPWKLTWAHMTIWKNKHLNMYRLFENMVTFQPVMLVFRRDVSTLWCTYQ